MILTKVVLEQLKILINGLGFNCFLSIAPQGTSYPFITLMPVVSVEIRSFGQIYDNCNVAITIYCNANNVATLMNMASAIESSLEYFDYTDGSNHIYCTHKENEVGPIFNNKESYWSYSADYTFKCQRERGT